MYDMSIVPNKFVIFLLFFVSLIPVFFVEYIARYIVRRAEPKSRFNNAWCEPQLV
jgi:hypothetical protein